jgi:hypothetical protein
MQEAGSGVLARHMASFSKALGATKSVRGDGGTMRWERGANP